MGNSLATFTANGSNPSYTFPNNTPVPGTPRPNHLIVLTTSSQGLELPTRRQIYLIDEGLPMARPVGADYFLVYTKNSEGEMSTNTRKQIIDLEQIPIQSPRLVAFTDGDPTQGEVSGTITITLFIAPIKIKRSRVMDQQGL